MKRHSEKLSLRQPTGTSTARATGFSKEQVGIFFYLYEKEFAVHDYPPSLIFNVGSKQTTKNPRTEKQTSDWPFNCRHEGVL